MPTTNLTTDLPETLIAKLDAMRGIVSDISNPYVDERGQRIRPRTELSVRMPESQTVQVILKCWKPNFTSRVVAEFSDDAFDALKTKVMDMQMSWEAYMEQVCVNG